MEKYPGYKTYDYANVLSSAEVRELSEDIGLYAGGLSLALMGVNPETLDNRYPSSIALPQPAEEEFRMPEITELEELSRSESLQRLTRLSLRGSVEPLTKADMRLAA